MNNTNNNANGMGNPAESCIGQGTKETSRTAVGLGAQTTLMDNAWFATDPSSIMGQIGIPVGSVGGAPVFIHPANNGAVGQVVSMGWGSTPVSQPRETIVLPSADGIFAAQSGGQPVSMEPSLRVDSGCEVPASSGQVGVPKASAPQDAANGGNSGSLPGFGSADGLLRTEHPPPKYANGTAKRTRSSGGRQPRKERRKRQDVPRAHTAGPKKAIKKVAGRRVSGNLRVVPAQADEPGKKTSVGEASIVKANDTNGLAAGVTTPAEHGKEQGSAPNPDLSTQGDSFPPSIVSNPVDPSSIPSEAQQVDDGKKKSGNGENVHGGATKGNDAGRRRKRKPRTYTTAVPSQHCHICSRRPIPDFPHFVCGNLLRYTCRKTICTKCFDFYKWDAEAVRNAEPGTWLCNHCREDCPPRSQCKIYNRTSERRRLKLINHRKKKTANSSNPNNSAAAPKKSAQQSVAASGAQPSAIPVAAGGSDAIVQNAQVGVNQGTTTAGPSAPPVQSLPQNQGGQPAPGNPQNPKSKRKRAPKRRRKEGQSAKASKKAKTEERVVLASSKKDFVAQMKKHGGNIREMVRHSEAAPQSAVQQGPAAIPLGTVNLPNGNTNMNPTVRHMQQPVVLPPFVPNGNQSTDQAQYNMEQLMAHPPSVPQGSLPVGDPITRSIPHPIQQHAMQPRMAYPPSLPQTATQPVGYRSIHTPQLIAYPPSVSQGNVTLQVGNPNVHPTPRNGQQSIAHNPSVPNPPELTIGQDVAQLHSTPQVDMVPPAGNILTNPAQIHLHQAVMKAPNMPQRHGALPLGNQTIDPAHCNTQQSTVPQAAVVQPTVNQNMDPVLDNMHTQQAIAHPPIVPHGNVVLAVGNHTIDPSLGKMQQALAHTPTVLQGSVVLPLGNQTNDQSQADIQHRVAWPSATSQEHMMVMPTGNQKVTPALGNLQQSVAHVAQASIEMEDMQSEPNHTMINVGGIPHPTAASGPTNVTGEVAVRSTCATQEDDICRQVDEAIAAATRAGHAALQALQGSSEVNEGNLSDIRKSALADTAGIVPGAPTLERREKDGGSASPKKQSNPSIVPTSEHGIDEGGQKRAKQLEAMTAGVDETTVRERGGVESLVDSFLADDMQPGLPLLGSNDAVPLPGGEQLGMVGNDDFGDLRLAVHEALQLPELPVEGLGDNDASGNREQGELFGSGGDHMNFPDFDVDVGSSSLSALNGL